MSLDLSLDASVSHDGEEGLSQSQSSAGLHHSLFEDKLPTCLRHLCKALPDYEWLGELGRGGMGQVFLVRDRGSGQRLALKALPLAGLSASTRQRFVREISILRSVSHAHIVRLVSYGETPALLYYCMEYFPAGDLCQWRARQSELSESEIVAGIRGPLEALRLLHQLSTRVIIHRDIKPRNIFVRDNGEWVLGDFGLALRARDQTMTRTHARLGSPHYMSPEQVRGQAHWVDARADIYSVGAVLYFLQSGKRPFEREARGGVGELFERVLNEPLRRPVGMSGDFWALVSGAMAKNREHRPGAVDEFLRALKAFEEGLSLPTVGAAKESFWQRLCGFFKHRRGGLAARRWQRRQELRRELRASLDLARGQMRRKHWLYASQTLKTLKRGGELPELHLELARCYRELGRPSEALAELAAARDLNPYLWRVYVEYGHVHRRQGRYSLALREYQRAAELGLCPGLQEAMLECCQWLQRDEQAARIEAQVRQSREVLEAREWNPSECMEHSLGDEAEALVPSIEGLELQEKVGEGGLAEVFRAWDVEQGHGVAVKFLHPLSGEAAVEQLKREYEWLRSLRHCSEVVRVDGLGQCFDRWYMVLEWIEGETLLEQLEAGRFSRAQPREIVRVALELCRGLEVMHSQGRVHGDIKPHNLVFDRVQGRYRWIDPLGCGDGLGTPVYMSPESARGGFLDERSEVYSLGAVLYQMLSGRAPVQRSVLLESPRPLPGGWPRDLVDMIAKALNPKRSQRYGRALELAEDCERFLAGEAVSARRGRSWSWSWPFGLSGVGLWAGRRWCDERSAWSVCQNFLALAGDHMSRGEFAEAEEKVDWALESDGESVEACRLKAELLALRESKEEHGRWLERAIELAPESLNSLCRKTVLAVTEEFLECEGERDFASMVELVSQARRLLALFPVFHEELVRNRSGVEILNLMFELIFPESGVEALVLERSLERFEALKESLLSVNAQALSLLVESLVSDSEEREQAVSHFLSRSQRDLVRCLGLSLRESCRGVLRDWPCRDFTGRVRVISEWSLVFALRWLRVLGDRESGALVLPLLSDGRVGVREAAFETFREIGSAKELLSGDHFNLNVLRMERVVELLRGFEEDWLEDLKEFLRGYAWSASVDLGPLGELLSEALMEERLDVRWCEATALDCGQAVVTAELAYLVSEYRGALSGELCGRLREVLTVQRDWQVRPSMRRAYWALGGSGVTGCFETLRGLLESTPVAHCRRWALEGLGRIRSGRSGLYLIRRATGVVSGAERRMLGRSYPEVEERLRAEMALIAELLSSSKDDGLIERFVESWPFVGSTKYLSALKTLVLVNHVDQ